MKKVLISAFKPFNMATNNYSNEVLNHIYSSKYDLTKVIIDVVYDECFKELSKNNLDEYDLIVALGEARSRKVLTIEKNAFNIASCSIADNAGVLRKDTTIIDNGNELLETVLDLEKCKDYGEISFNPGKFVCNNLYYHLLNYNNNKSIFIHIPNCKDDENLYRKYALDVLNIISILLE